MIAGGPGGTAAGRVFAPAMRAVLVLTDGGPRVFAIAAADAAGFAARVAAALGLPPPAGDGLVRGPLGAVGSCPVGPSGGVALIGGSRAAPVVTRHADRLSAMRAAQRQGREAWIVPVEAPADLERPPAGRPRPLDPGFCGGCQDHPLEDCDRDGLCRACRRQR